jgi:hypothetical protein
MSTRRAAPAATRANANANADQATNVRKGPFAGEHERRVTGT